jgi:hypothetical protein
VGDQADGESAVSWKKGVADEAVVREYLKVKAAKGFPGYFFKKRTLEVLRMDNGFKLVMDAPRIADHYDAYNAIIRVFDTDGKMGNTQVITEFGGDVEVRVGDTTSYEKEDERLFFVDVIGNTQDILSHIKRNDPLLYQKAVQAALKNERCKNNGQIGRT